MLGVSFGQQASTHHIGEVKEITKICRSLSAKCYFKPGWASNEREYEMKMKQDGFNQEPFYREIICD